MERTRNAHGNIVNPGEIDRTLFIPERVDDREEWLRKLMCAAHYQWRHTGRREFEVVTSGGVTGSWVELALYWAWQIQNGASWEKLCNETTGEKAWFVIWKDGYGRLVGGPKVPQTRISLFSYRRVPSSSIQFRVRYI